METPGPRIYKESGPATLKEVLSQLFTARGWGRRQGRLHLEKAWAAAVGAEQEKHTRVVGLRRGVLEVEVNNGVLLQELAHFQKRRLLEAIRASLADTTITDLRFKAGSWNTESP
jgi:predicted nucleic acid-binding Zn ribbon protein